MAELRTPQPGGALIAEHLAQTLLIEALRLHISERPAHGTGWLCALADRPLCAAITAMHAEPARRWTLAALAQVAGLSRSSFAARFTATVGEPAMAYLTRWRMMLAADRLASGRMPVSAIAPGRRLRLGKRLQRRLQAHARPQPTRLHPRPRPRNRNRRRPHSHSIVPGGLLVMS